MFQLMPIVSPPPITHLCAEPRIQGGCSQLLLKLSLLEAEQAQDPPFLLTGDKSSSPQPFS